jgi:N-acetyl-gamma-glutamyl-phosphate reductase
MNTITISIIGASGYSGAELVRILLHHPRVKIDHVFANSSAGKQVDELYPLLKSRTNLKYETYTPDLVKDSDLVFIALPSGEAMNFVPELLSAGKRIIDLGGDFRLKDAGLYKKYYKREHTSASFLSHAVYGIPEWNKEKIESAKLLSNPGCYATSAILSLGPLIKENLVESEGIVISSLSGVTGAGRSASLEYSFSEVNESVRAYKVGTHQHTPEIQAALEEIAARPVRVTFVPHLLPITRGIYSSAYGVLKKKVAAENVKAVYDKYYGSSCFIRYGAGTVPEIKNVTYTNYCDIGFSIDEENNKLIVLSVIDNLVKGAAGQAVQNMNLMFNFGETEGLL